MTVKYNYWSKLITRGYFIYFRGENTYSFSSVSLPFLKRDSRVSNNNHVVPQTDVLGGDIVRTRFRSLGVSQGSRWLSHPSPSSGVVVPGVNGDTIVTVRQPS